MSVSRVLAIFWARLKEFYRDRASLGWALVFPLVLVGAFSVMFKGDGQQPPSLGLVSLEKAPAEKGHWEKSFRVSIYKEQTQALNLLSHHKLDLVVNLESQEFWLNPQSARSKTAFALWREFIDPTDRVAGFTARKLEAPPLSYAAWAFPGILSMNVMFSSLFGVGWVLVHYRKTKVLRRLKVTPLRAAEFLTAQILARLVIVAFNTSLVFGLGAWILGIVVKGSWMLLALSYGLGALSLISIGVLVASRTSSEELASGVINLMTWPMMLLSEIWFSLEGLPKWVESIAQAMPLTHLNRAVRAIVNDGSGMSQIQSHLWFLAGLSILFLALGSFLFRWEAES